MAQLAPVTGNFRRVRGLGNAQFTGVSSPTITAHTATAVLLRGVRTGLDGNMAEGPFSPRFWATP